MRRRDARIGGAGLAALPAEVAHEEGRGVDAKSDAEAVQWYAKAADQGHAEALYRLGVMYADDGRGRHPSDQFEIEEPRHAEFGLEIASGTLVLRSRQNAGTQRGRWMIRAHMDCAIRNRARRALPIRLPWPTYAPPHLCR